MQKKIMSFVLTAIMVMSLIPTAFAAEEVTHNCNSSDCIVCDLAKKINDLPAATDISVDNAASVIDQIHSIDRIKGELEYEQYDELLTLVERGNDGSGHGTDVPVRYMNAVQKIQLLDGNSLYITKMFVSNDGAEVNVSNAQVQISVTNTDTNVSQTFTMSAMKDVPSTLSYNSDFYCVNKEDNGWTYKYILPAGNYRVEEVSYSGATVDGQEFVTTEVTYNGNTSADGTLVTFAEGAAGNTNIYLTNARNPYYYVNAKDADGNPVTGVKMSIAGTSWITDDTDKTFDSLMTGGEYTLTVDSVPEGYEMPNPASVTFDAGWYSALDAPFELTQVSTGYKLTVTIPTVKAEEGSVTINFVGRDGEPLKVDCSYAYGSEDEDGDGFVDFTGVTDDGFCNVSSYTMKNLLDGFYDVTILNAYENGYDLSGSIEFEIKDGKIVYEEYDEETATGSPASSTHSILDVNVKTGTITVEVASITYSFIVDALGLNVWFPYVVKDINGNEVAGEYDGEDGYVANGQVHLNPGKYTFHSIALDGFEDYVKFPGENECVEFTVNADYTITVTDSMYNTEITDYIGSYTLKWYLELESTVEVTATISTADGTNFPDDTTITLGLWDFDAETGETISYSELSSITVPTNVSEYTYTWTVAAYHLGYDENGDQNKRENSYQVSGTDFNWNEIYFSSAEKNKWTATVSGRGIETEVMADAGYYASTSDSEEKSGAIVLNAHIANIQYIYEKVAKYGMFLYKGDEIFEVNVDVNDASDKVSQLVEDDGYYHVIIKNIAMDDFDTTFYGVPFVVMNPDGDAYTEDEVVLTGETVYATVNEYGKWLGANNPY